MVTEHQFEQLLAGASIAHAEDLHRLGSLLNAVLAVSVEPTEQNLTNLYEWAAKVAGDLVVHKQKAEQ